MASHHEGGTLGLHPQTKQSITTIWQLRGRDVGQPGARLAVHYDHYSAHLEGRGRWAATGAQTGSPVTTVHLEGRGRWAATPVLRLAVSLTTMAYSILRAGRWAAAPDWQSITTTMAPTSWGARTLGSAPVLRLAVRPDHFGLTSWGARDAGQPHQCSVGSQPRPLWHTSWGEDARRHTRVLRLAKQSSTTTMATHRPGARDVGQPHWGLRLAVSPTTMAYILWGQDAGQPRSAQTGSHYYMAYIFEGRGRWAACGAQTGSPTIWHTS
jgi:hypothetical protein